MILQTIETMESDTIELLRSMEPPEGYYLAFSGGKDSIVLHEITRRSGVKFDAHYNITTVDPPELVKFIRDEYPRVKMERPPETMWELIPRKLMPPTRVVRYCCDVLKEGGGAGRVVLTGVRAAESFKRSKQKQITSCNKSGKVIIRPIFSWEDHDVWQYIHLRKMDSPRLYSEGFKRLGCVGCPMTGPEQQRHEFNRWPKIGLAYVRAFQRMVDRRKERRMKCEWITGEDVMRWWCGWKPPSIAGDTTGPAVHNELRLDR
jgi:phosphoadenosine phosphosulfate reductase